jgi:hypothetical protein
MDYVTR